jgi:hypothetical protein
MPSFWIEFEQNGSRQQRSFESNAVSFGREQGVDFVVNNPTVSRQHAMIMFDPRSGYVLRVLSRGGMTAINGAPVAGDVPLQDGSMVNLGQFGFVFRAAAAQPQPQSQFGSGGFGGQMNSGGFGSQSPAPAPQPQGGFGGQLGSGGFGAQMSPAGQMNSGGFGSQSPAPTPQAPAPQGNAGGGPKAAGNTVWDEIAASAEAQEDGGPRELTDFQKMQEAENRADKGGPNPILLLVTVLAIIGVGAVVLLSGGAGEDVVDKEIPFDQQPEFQITSSCVGQDDCVEQARQSYKVGLQLLEKKEANVSHLFDGYKKLYEAKYLLDKGKAPAPADMSELDTKMQSSRAELDGIFRNYRVVYFTGLQRKMYKDMAASLAAIKTYFPDQTAREFKFATEKEIEMKSQGTYPARID